jgi:hypothetical protein
VNPAVYSTSAPGDSPAALDVYLTDRAERAEGVATAIGGRLRQGHLWELVRRLARTAGIAPLSCRVRRRSRAPI